jgi:hypothetical protein
MAGGFFLLSLSNAKERTYQANEAGVCKWNISFVVWR